MACKAYRQTFHHAVKVFWCCLIITLIVTLIGKKYLCFDRTVIHYDRKKNTGLTMYFIKKLFSAPKLEFLSMKQTESCILFSNCWNVHLVLYNKGIQHLRNDWVKSNNRQFYVKQNDRFCQCHSSSTQQSELCQWVLRVVFYVWAWKMEVCSEASSIIFPIQPSIPGQDGRLCAAQHCSTLVNTPYSQSTAIWT